MLVQILKINAVSVFKFLIWHEVEKLAEKSPFLYNGKRRVLIVTTTTNRPLFLPPFL